MKKILFTITTLAGFLFFGVFPAFADTTAVNYSAGSNLSTNWAGYVSNSGQYTSVSGTWIVPQVGLADLTTGDATWVGIGGVGTSDLIQSGTQAIVDSYGNITYSSWYETLPNTSMDLPVAVKPGDSVSVSIQQISNGLWQISFRDNTTGQNYSTNVNYTSSLSSAEWIEEMPTINNSFLPLDNFGTTNFMNGYTIKNGSEVNIANSGAAMITMINSSNQVTAETSNLGSDGASFSVTRTLAVAGISTTTPTVRNFRGRGGVRTGIRVQNFKPSQVKQARGRFDVRNSRMTNRFFFGRIMAR